MKVFFIILIFFFAAIFYSCGPSCSTCAIKYAFKGKISNPGQDSLKIEITNVGSVIFGNANSYPDQGTTIGDSFWATGEFETDCRLDLNDFKESKNDLIISITKSTGEIIQKKLDKEQFSIYRNDSLFVIDIGNIKL
jgi:hypothetical protein